MSYQTLVVTDISDCTRIYKHVMYMHHQTELMSSIGNPNKRNIDWVTPISDYAQVKKCTHRQPPKKNLFLCGLCAFLICNYVFLKASNTRSSPQHNTYLPNKSTIVIKRVFHVFIFQIKGKRLTLNNHVHKASPTIALIS